MSAVDDHSHQLYSYASVPRQMMKPPDRPVLQYYQPPNVMQPPPGAIPSSPSRQLGMYAMYGTHQPVNVRVPPPTLPFHVQPLPPNHPSMHPLPPPGRFMTQPRHQQQQFFHPTNVYQQAPAVQSLSQQQQQMFQCGGPSPNSPRGRMITTATVLPFRGSPVPVHGQPGPRYVHRFSQAAMPAYQMAQHPNFMQHNMSASQQYATGLTNRFPPPNEAIYGQVPPSMPTPPGSRVPYYHQHTAVIVQEMPGPPQQPRTGVVQQSSRREWKGLPIVNPETGLVIDESVKVTASNDVMDHRRSAPKSASGTTLIECSDTDTETVPPASSFFEPGESCIGTGNDTANSSTVEAKTSAGGEEPVYETGNEIEVAAEPTKIMCRAVDSQAEVTGLQTNSTAHCDADGVEMAPATGNVEPVVTSEVPSASDRQDDDVLRAPVDSSHSQAGSVVAEHCSSMAAIVLRGYPVLPEQPSNEPNNGQNDDQLQVDTDEERATGVLSTCATTLQQLELDNEALSARQLSLPGAVSDDMQIDALSAQADLGYFSQSSVLCVGNVSRDNAVAMSSDLIAESGKLVSSSSDHESHSVVCRTSFADTELPLSAVMSPVASRTYSSLVSIAEELPSGNSDVKAMLNELDIASNEVFVMSDSNENSGSCQLIRQLSSESDQISVFESRPASTGSEPATPAGRRSRKSSKDLNRTDGQGSREYSYNRGPSSEPPLSPLVIESGRRAMPRSSSSSMLTLDPKASSPVTDSVHSVDHRLVNSLSHGDLSGSQGANKVRYDRDFLLRLQHAPDSLRKPTGLPVLPEIILNQPALRQHQLPPGFSAVIASPRCNPNGPNLLPRRSLSEVNPVMNRSLSGGSMGSGGSSSRNGRRGSQPPLTSGRKVIQVALQQPVQLHTTENAWKPISLKQESVSLNPDQLESEALYRKLRAILNKLTPQKFESLRDQVLALPIDTEERLKGCINIIFEKDEVLPGIEEPSIVKLDSAIDEPQFSVGYANLAKSMINLKVPGEQETCETVSFRKLLLNQCQQEFEKDKQDETDMERRQLAIDTCTSEDVKRQLMEEKEQAEMKSRRRSLGNIRFIGELFKLKMLTEGIMRDCVKKLLRDSDDDSLECLCRLLSTIGKDLEDKSEGCVRQYFHSIGRIIRDGRVSNRIRFMLQDVTDLRNNDWIPRREDNKPKTIDQIRLEAEQQKATTLLRVQSTPVIVDNRLRHRGSVDNWKSPSASIDAAKIRLTRQSTDDSIQLGPGSGRPDYAQWQSGSNGGVNSIGRTLSIDREQQARLLFELRSQADPYNSMMMRGSREMALQSKARERNAALEAVRSIMSSQSLPRPFGPDVGNFPLSSGSNTIQCSSVPAEPLPSPVTAMNAEFRAELQRKLKSIVKELIEIKDFQEAVVCICDLNCSNFMSEVVSQTINDVLEWSRESRCLCGQLHWHLINSRVLTVDHLKEVLTTVEDMEIDIPKIWLYLSEVISPLIQMQPVVPMTFLESAFEPLLHNPRVADVIVHVINDAASRLGRPVIARMWHESGMDWSKFVTNANVEAFLGKNDLKWIEWGAASSSSADARYVANDVIDVQFTQQLHRLICSSAVTNDEIISVIKDVVDVDTCSLQFIDALTTAIGSTSLRGDERHGYTVDSELLKMRAPLLSRYVMHEMKWEVHVLHILERLVHQRQHPANILSTLFEVLSLEDVISEESFDHWYQGKASRDYPGKAVARASTVQFFQWLHSSNNALVDKF